MIDRMLGVRERRPRVAVDLVPGLAGQLLGTIDVGARMPTVRSLARTHRSSVASIHAAIATLQEAGAIETQARGRSGTFLIGRSVGRLWSIAEGGPLVIALPLMSSRRYEALATAIKQVLTTAGQEVFLIFVRGSRQRLQAVRSRRCHLAVMSSFAASQLCGPDDAVVVRLAPGTYNTGHRVYFAPPSPDSYKLRVVVDPHSADQQLLTALEYAGKDIDLIPAVTTQITRLLSSGQADEAVWTIDEMEAALPVGILNRPLADTVVDHLGDRDTRAVLVGRSDQAACLRSVTAGIMSDQIEHIQQAVIDGQLVAEY